MTERRELQPCPPRRFTYAGIATAGLISYITGAFGLVAGMATAITIIVGAFIAGCIRAAFMHVVMRNTERKS